MSDNTSKLVDACAKSAAQLEAMYQTWKAKDGGHGA